MTISLLTHIPQAPFQDSRPPSSYNPVCHDLSSSSASPLLTTAPVDLIKTRVQQGDATLSKQQVSLVLARTTPMLTLPFCPGTAAPFALPHDRSFLPPGYSVFGVAHPQR